MSDADIHGTDDDAMKTMLDMLSGPDVKIEENMNVPGMNLPDMRHCCTANTPAFVDAVLDVRLWKDARSRFMPMEGDIMANQFVAAAELTAAHQLKRDLVDGLYFAMPTARPNVFRPYPEHKDELMRQVYNKHKHKELNGHAKAASEFLYSWTLQCEQFLREHETLIKNWAHDTNPWKLFGHENPKPAPIVEVLISVITNHRLEGTVEHQRAPSNWKWCRNALCMAFLCCGWGDLASLLMATRVQTSCAAMMQSSARAAAVLEDMALPPTCPISPGDEELNLFDIAALTCQSHQLPDVCDLDIPDTSSVDDMHASMCGLWDEVDDAIAREARIPVICRILPDMMKIGSDLLLLHGLLLNHMQSARATGARRDGPPRRPPQTVDDLNRERCTLCQRVCQHLVQCLSELGTTQRRLAITLATYTLPLEHTQPIHGNMRTFLTTACDSVRQCAQSTERILVHHNHLAQPKPPPPPPPVQQQCKRPVSTRRPQGIRRIAPATAALNPKPNPKRRRNGKGPGLSAS